MFDDWWKFTIYVQSHNKSYERIILFISQYFFVHSVPEVRSKTYPSKLSKSLISERMMQSCECPREKLSKRVSFRTQPLDTLTTISALFFRKMKKKQKQKRQKSFKILKILQKFEILQIFSISSRAYKFPQIRRNFFTPGNTALEFRLRPLHSLCCHVSRYTKGRGLMPRSLYLLEKHRIRNIFSSVFPWFCITEPRLLTMRSPSSEITSRVRSR